MIRWGDQIDTRPMNIGGPRAGDGQGAGVAGYLAKYATKDAQAGGGLDRRIRVEGVIEAAELSDHARALMRSAWTLSPRWAHNLGLSWPLPDEGSSLLGHLRCPPRRSGGLSSPGRSWLTQIRAKAIGDQVVIRRSFHYAGSGLSPAERAVAASFRASPTSPDRSGPFGTAGSMKGAWGRNGRSLIAQTCTLRVDSFVLAEEDRARRLGQIPGILGSP